MLPLTQMTGYSNKLFLFVIYFAVDCCIPASSLCRDGQRKHRNCELLPRDDQCGAVSVDRKVVGGHAATLGQFPWIAILVNDFPGSNGSKGTQLLCGGSIINDRYIVSAAHCVERVGTLRIKLGEHNLSSALDCPASGEGECASEVQAFEVEEFIHHPLYNPQTIENDLLLVRLKGKVTFTRFVHPICLPMDNIFKNERIFRGKQFDLAGWGIYNQEKDMNTMPDVLQTVSLPYVPRRRCEKALGRRLTSAKLCAGGDRGRDACMGDSGGPLMGQFSPRRSRNRYFLVGVVSYGRGVPCGQADFPGVYVNVAQFITWLLDNIY